MERQLENAVSLRSSQDGVLWTIFGAFSAVNAILFVALFTGGKTPPGPVGFLIAFVGFIQALVWYRIQDRALSRIRIYEEIMEQIIPQVWNNAASLPVWMRLFKRSCLGASRVMRLSAVFFGAVWLSLLIYFAVQLLLGR